MIFLGMDIGTSGTKVLALSADGGKIVATAESPHELLTPRIGWTEQHPEHWWAAVRKATAMVLKKGRIPAGSVRGIGLSGQMHGSVFVDGAGKVLRPALLWNDQRTVTQCAEIEHKAGGRAALIERVGNPALTGFTAPKILWLREHERKTFDRCRQVLLPKDYIRFRLTGGYATEVSDASGTLLLDVKNRQWHHGLLDLLQLDPALFPAVTESQEVTGVLTASAAKLLGLRAGIPVVGGAGDQAAGAVGTGVVRPGLVSAAMGTSGVIFATSDGPRTDPQGRVHTMCHAIPNTWCVFGCMLSAGGSLQWLRNMMFPAEMANAKDPVAPRRKPGALANDALLTRQHSPGLPPRSYSERSYSDMIAEAEAVEPGAEHLLFAPYLTGERCPHADPTARGAFVGLSARHTRAHLIRAVLEGITFGMAEQVAIFRQMQIPIQQIRLSGGGARSPFWRQLQADIYRATVATVSATEGAALGAAILAAVGTAQYPSVAAACKALIHVEEVRRPQRKAANFYAERFTHYTQLYPALKPLAG